MNGTVDGLNWVTPFAGWDRVLKMDEGEGGGVCSRRDEVELLEVR